MAFILRRVTWRQGHANIPTKSSLGHLDGCFKLKSYYNFTHIVAIRYSTAKCLDFVRHSHQWKLSAKYEHHFCYVPSTFAADTDENVPSVVTTGEYPMEIALNLNLQNETFPINACDEEDKYK